MAGFKIVDFYEQALRKDFSRKYQMRVIGIGGRLGPEQNVFATAATLPGYTVANTAAKFMGMSFNIPAHGEFTGSDAWDITFRCDLNFDIRGLFETWQRDIFNAVPDLNISNIASSTGYYHIPDVSQTIRLGLHDRDGFFYRKYSLIGCYPTKIDGLSYDQTAGGDVQELKVTLAYQYWILEQVSNAGANILAANANPDVGAGLGSAFA